MKYLDYSGLQYYDEKLKGYVQSSLDKYVPYIENAYGGAKIVNANSFVQDSTTYSQIGAGLDVSFSEHDTVSTKYFRTGVFMKRETGSQLLYSYLSGLQYYFEDGRLNATKYQVTNESTGQGSATPSFTITGNGITLNDVKSDTNLLNSNGGVVSIDDIKLQVQYTLPAASTTQLGGVKVGDGLEITQEGVLNCIIDPGSGTVSWGNISGKPTFATVATSGSYNDLTDTPNIEVASEEEIDALFI